MAKVFESVKTWIGGSFFQGGRAREDWFILMLWRYLVCNVKFGGLGLSSYDLVPNYNIFLKLTHKLHDGNGLFC